MGSSHAWILSALAVVGISGCASHFQRGEEAFGKRDYGTAITEYTFAVDGNAPEKGEALYKRCIAKLNKGDEPGARADYDEAIRQTPTLASRTEYPEFFYSRAVSEAQIGSDDAKAKADHAEALRATPEFAKKQDFVEIFYGRALARLKAGDDKGALAAENEAERIQSLPARRLEFLTAAIAAHKPTEGYAFLLSLKQSRAFDPDETKAFDKAEDDYLTWAFKEVEDFQELSERWGDAYRLLEATQTNVASSPRAAARVAAAKAKFIEALYAAASTAQTRADFDPAKERFALLGDYSDSRARLAAVEAAIKERDCQRNYDKAKSLLAQHDTDLASQEQEKPKIEPTASIRANYDRLCREQGSEYAKGWLQAWLKEDLRPDKMPALYPSGGTRARPPIVEPRDEVRACYERVVASSGRDFARTWLFNWQIHDLKADAMPPVPARARTAKQGMREPLTRAESLLRDLGDFKDSKALLDSCLKQDAEWEEAARRSVPSKMTEGDKQAAPGAGVALKMKKLQARRDDELSDFLSFARLEIVLSDSETISVKFDVWGEARSYADSQSHVKYEAVKAKYEIHSFKRTLGTLEIIAKARTATGEIETEILTGDVGEIVNGEVPFSGEIQQTFWDGQKMENGFHSSVKGVFRSGP